MKKDKRYYIYYFMIIFFIIICLRVFIYIKFDSKIPNGALRFHISNIYRFFIWVLPVFLYLIFVDKVNPFHYLKLTTSIKKGILYSVAVLAAGALWQFIEYKFANDTITNFSFLSILALVIIPVFEEILARGFILNKLCEIMPTKKVLPLSAGFFWLCHIPGWPFIGSPIPLNQFIVYSISVFIVVGIGCGILMKKSNSLYPSIVLHAVNNFISSI